MLEKAKLRILYLYKYILDLPWQLKQSQPNDEQVETGYIRDDLISPILRIEKSIYLCSFFLAVCTAIFLVTPFVNNITFLFVATFILACFIFKLFNHLIGRRKLQINELAFHSFLQELSSLIHNGCSMENAILEIAPHLSNYYGKKSPLADILANICSAISNGWTINDLNREFMRLFPNNYAYNYFTILHDPVSISNHLLSLSRTFSKNISAKSNLEKEIAANAAQQQMEAVILAIMPFIIIYTLRFLQGDFFSPALTTMPGPLLLTAAFFFIILSMLVLFRLFLPQKLNINKAKLPLPNSYIRKIAGLIWPFILVAAPVNYIDKLKSNLTLLYSLVEKQNNDKQDNLSQMQNLLITYFAAKIRLILLMSGIVLLFCLSNILFIILLPPAIIIAFVEPDFTLNRKCQKYKLLLLHTFPWDFSLLILLLKNNYSLINSIGKLEKLLPDNDILKQKFAEIYHENTLGKYSDNTFFRFGEKLQIMPLNNCLSALRAYITGGDIISLKMLSEQTEQLFIGALQEQKKAQSKRQSAFVLPMMLDLIAVILITLAPIIPNLAY